MNRNLFDQILATRAGKDLSSLATPQGARLMLVLTAKLESNFVPNAVSPRGAMGMFQFLPSTVKLFKRAYPHLPDWIDADPFNNGQFACYHLVENLNLAYKRAPSFSFPATPFGRDLPIQRARFFYVNGPQPKPKFPHEIEADQNRLAADLSRLASPSDKRHLWESLL